MLLSALRRKFSLFLTQKEFNAEKQKIWPFLVNLLENSPCKRSHLIVISESNSSHSINGVCDMLHQ